VFFHDEATQLAIKFRKQVGIDNYNLLISLVAGTALVMLLVYTFYHIMKSQSKAIKISYLFLSCFLMVLFYRTALVYNIEAIHFAQYMMLAILVFPLLRSYGETVFWVSMMGILDEVYQYLILTPDFSYFDFNDVVLNLIGAGLGVVIVFISSDYPSMKYLIFRKPSFWFFLLFFAVVSISIFSGVFALYPVEANATGNEPFLILNRSAPEANFWTKLGHGRVYHIIRPLEGVIIMCVLFAVYHLLDWLSFRKIV